MTFCSFRGDFTILNQSETGIDNGGHIVTGSKWGIIAEEKLFGLVQRIHSRVSADYKQQLSLASMLCRIKTHCCRVSHRHNM
jgi:hypothetical protein